MATLNSTRMSDVARAMAEELDDGLVLESLPVGVYVCSADGLIVRYNRAAATLWGREPRPGEPGERFCGSYRLLDLGGTHVPSAECPMAIALATGQSYRDQRIQIERPDGSRIVALVNIEVLKNGRGQVTGAVNVFRDSASLSRGHGQAVDRTEELEAVLQALPAAIYTTDLEGRITFYNEAAAELWGVRPELHRSEFCGSWKLYWPDGTYLPHDQCPMAIALKERRAIRGKEAVAERPDGTRVPFLAHPTPLLDQAGMFTGAVNMLVDITDRRRSEEQKDLLLQEMDHRVKNLFALANGMVTLSGRKATSIATLVSDLQGRFGALSRAHSLTMPRGRDRETEPVATLHALIYKVTGPYLNDGAEGRVVVTGLDLAIGPATVTNFALLIHELATNALKYGALAVAHGKVRIECLDEGDGICITWRERGTPGDSSEPLEEGFGSRLARATIEGPLGGSFSREFKSDGVEIRLRLPRHRMSD